VTDKQIRAEVAKRTCRLCEEGDPLFGTEQHHSFLRPCTANHALADLVVELVQGTVLDVEEGLRQ
jgi:hypothetical protein